MILILLRKTMVEMYFPNIVKQYRHFVIQDHLLIFQPFSGSGDMEKEGTNHVCTANLFSALHGQTQLRICASLACYAGA